jgi:hypothetical protein
MATFTYQHGEEESQASTTTKQCGREGKMRRDDEELQGRELGSLARKQMVPSKGKKAQ